MRPRLPFPPSFPDAAEERFIRLVLCADAEFPRRWAEWKRNTVFDDIDFATLRLLPLLHLWLSSLGIEDDEITGRIRGAYKLAWFRNQQLLEEVRAFAELCQAEDIPVLLLKGLALLINVYGNAGARFVGDGDILVDPKHVPKAFSLLESRGWTCQEPLLLSGDDWVKSRYGSLCHAAMFRNDKDVELDLHWQTFHIDNSVVRMLLLRDLPSMPPVNAHHWRNSIMTEYKGTPLRTLSLEDTLVHVIEHGAAGNPHRALRWVVDAAHIIRKGTLDWDRVAKITANSGLEIHLQMALRYLEERAGVAIPASVMKTVEQWAPTPKAVRKYYRIAEWRPWAEGRLLRIWYMYWRMESREGFVARCRGLPAYLRRAWGIERKQSLKRVIFEKCRVRVGQWLAHKNTVDRRAA